MLTALAASLLTFAAVIVLIEVRDSVRRRRKARRPSTRGDDTGR
jgi:hypothetical protein